MKHVEGKKGFERDYPVYDNGYVPHEAGTQCATKL